MERAAFGLTRVHEATWQLAWPLNSIVVGVWMIVTGVDEELYS